MSTVVFNPTDEPISFATGNVGSHEWAFVPDQGDVQKYLDRGRLVIAEEPDDIYRDGIAPSAQHAFGLLVDARSQQEAEDESEPTPDPEPVPESTSTKSRAKRKSEPVRDTEASSPDATDEEQE